MKNTIWTEEELNFLRKNYMNMTNAEMATALDRTKTAVDLKLNRLGIHKSKYFYDQNYFSSIDTDDKAYWLGFISADGFVQFRQEENFRNYELGIELDHTDKNHLKLFNKAIKGNLEVHERSRKSYFDSNKIHSTAFIRIYSKKIVEDLMSLGVVQNKSCVIKFNDNINYSLMPHYIRGYFDGNGCICCDSKKNNKLAVNFSSGSKEFLDGLRNHLYSNNIYSYITKESENKYRLYIKGILNCAKFLNYIYLKGDCLCLKRKYKKACTLFKKYDYARRLPLHPEMGGFLN